MVLWMYENDEDLEIPIDTSLYNITNEISFKKIVPQQVWEKIRAIRKVGNIALHENKKVTPEHALRVCEESFHVLFWLYRTYRSEEHTSELQSRGHLVCRLLLEKKNE